MERHFCMNCNVVGLLNQRGECGTCGSQSVVSEHSHNLNTNEMWPGYRAWAADALSRYRAMKAVQN